MALKGLAKRTIQAGVDNFTNFRVGNVSGDNSGMWRFGQLPYDFRDSLKKATYVVYSYSTPIGWYQPETGWTIPDHKYSVTTTNHQNTLRVATSNPHFYDGAKW